MAIIMATITRMYLQRRNAKLSKGLLIERSGPILASKLLDSVISLEQKITGRAVIGYLDGIRQIGHGFGLICREQI